MSARVRTWCALLAAVAVGGCGTGDGGRAAGGAPPVTVTVTVPQAAAPQVANGPVVAAGAGPSPLALKLDDPVDEVRAGWKRQPRAGVLFDLDTGEVLWRRNPTRVLPIASVTKMMTALVVRERLPPGTKVRITPQALATSGSKVGIFKLGERVGLSAMVHGLLLTSGNDAAIALAQAAGGSTPGFIDLMNAKAAQMGLRCSHFSTPSGLRNSGNWSCPLDLAALARAVLDDPWLARIVARRRAVFDAPVKGGRLYLSNHNPLLRDGYPGTLGVKTGYTEPAGRCLVAAAKRHGRRLGVVLLHAKEPGPMAELLLDRGFRATRAAG